ncbi:uncharacterized protein LOC116293446 isoform X2 [Actinia tenebrosa]|uniref:Uncharacterized protein LOC116293446 isoform X2 n=1 Tax=Actinia tenebrosa TaxID=6105 RepID=A0A6P8HLY3_ACTTE|nr:uncharacterized protein LOC116293446 isoform X2 [Actinia tenebrosa]
MYWFNANYILSASSTTDSFIDKPDEEVYRDEGSDVTLEWHFHVGSCSSSSTFREFLFGVWDDSGFVKNKILAVQENNVVSKGSGFERKVDWSGNIYDCVNCTAIVKMYNLTDADFKKYGVKVQLGFKRSPLTNWLRLVKFEPAEIINSSWPRRIEVEEGNATTIECKAKGRPTPSVIIKKKNRTLCNDSTGHCVYKIRKAKPADEGEYLCLVQQRNYSQIGRSLNLTVLEGRNISAIDTNAENRTTIKTTQNDTSVVVLSIIKLINNL